MPSQLSARQLPIFLPNALQLKDKYFWLEQSSPSRMACFSPLGARAVGEARAEEDLIHLCRAAARGQVRRLERSEGAALSGRNGTAPTGGARIGSASGLTRLYLLLTNISFSPLAPHFLVLKSVVMHGVNSCFFFSS